ncbi:MULTISPECIES: TetR/AcrR family transcriptional regulator [unclassified Mycobacterium]|uniref:TetR/AcrR family transcriptional regulator n=1 Tax=unclassified Mycobacterium TaxID=2642494 RepID=UPI0029C7E6F8|nr:MULTISPECIES: TetR/AcrR family transcriptional regulator [unclassified Mycobacterium]
MVSNVGSKRGSGAARPVEHKDEGRRAAILAAATKLFAEQGFRETNLNQIAEELGFRRQAVYHYFPSKEEILYELVAAAGEAMTQSSQALFDAKVSPEVALADVVRSHVIVVLSRADIFRVQFSELNKLTGKRAEVLRDATSAYVRGIADVIKRGQKAGTFFRGSAMTQALLVVGMCNWTTDWYRADQAHLTIEEVAEYAAQMAISGLIDKPASTRRRTATAKAPVPAKRTLKTVTRSNSAAAPARRPSPQKAKPSSR